MQNPLDFLTAFKGRKNQLLGFKSTMKLRVPKIETLLTELLDLLNPTTYFKYNIKQMGMPEIVGNPRFKQLVSELKKEMDEWLSNHP